MRGLGPRLGAIACASFALVVWTTPAVADDLPESKSLTLAVQGEIDQHCAMGSIPDLALGDLSTVRGEYRRHVTLDCNIPVDVVVKAENGALANTLYPQGQGPYKGRLGYRLGMSMPVRTPMQSVVRGKFQSSQLIGGATLSSGAGIAIDGLDLTVEFDQLRGDDALLGGDYAEVIEITITPT